jgi:hypothetical protein
MKLRLFTTYYNERKLARRRELETSLALNSPAFDELCVLAEGVEGPGPGNCIWRNLPERQTYRAVLNWAKIAGQDDVSIVANCDIVIPILSARRIAATIERNELYCISRYEVGPRGSLVLYDADYSQDVWAFRGSPPEIAGGYFFGIPGCENTFAREADALGWKILNPARSIQTIHLHDSHIRTATNSTSYRLPPPYLFIEPAYLGEEPAKRIVIDLAADRKSRRPRGERLLKQNGAAT